LRRTKITYDADRRKFDGIDESVQAVWKAAYPYVDVAGGLRKIVAWIESNRSRAPRSKFDRFINNWLKRAAEDANRQLPVDTWHWD